MEYTRSVKVTIEHDTNKKTREKVLEKDEDESISEFIERVRKEIGEVLEEDF